MLKRRIMIECNRTSQNVTDIQQTLDEVRTCDYNSFRLYNGYIYGGEN